MAKENLIVTYSSKNLDIKEIIENKRSSNVNISKYVSDAIRFYEKYKLYNFDNTSINLNEVKFSLEDIKILKDVFSSNGVIVGYNPPAQTEDLHVSDIVSNTDTDTDIEILPNIDVNNSIVANALDDDEDY